MDRIDHYPDLVFKSPLPNFFIGSRGVVLVRGGRLIIVNPSSVDQWISQAGARLPICNDYDSLTNDRFYTYLLEARSFYCKGDNGIIRGEHTHSYPEDRDESGRELSYNELPPSAKSDVDIWKHIDTQIMGNDYEKYGLYTPANPNAIKSELVELKALHKKHVEAYSLASANAKAHRDSIENKVNEAKAEHQDIHNKLEALGKGSGLEGLFGGLGIGAIAALGLGLYIVTRKK